MRSPMDEPILELDSVAYGTPDGRVLAENVNVRLDRGQLLLISGANGCGKSTLLKAILGRVPTSRGRLRCSVATDRIAYLPQLENTDVHLPFTLRDVLEASSAAAPCAATLGLLPADRLDAAWNTASGGERKRALVTRALLGDPSLLLFDEPMNHLDGESRRAVLGVLSRFLRAEPARAAVLVCHQGLEPDEAALFDVQRLQLGEPASC